MHSVANEWQKPESTVPAAQMHNDPAMTSRRDQQSAIRPIGSTKITPTHPDAAATAPSCVSVNPSSTLTGSIATTTSERSIHSQVNTVTIANSTNHRCGTAIAFATSQHGGVTTISLGATSIAPAGLDVGAGRIRVDPKIATCTWYTTSTHDGTSEAERKRLAASTYCLHWQLRVGEVVA